jgi:hypothetical protein
MKEKLYEHLWSILIYVLISGFVYYKSSADSDLLLMAMMVAFLVGVAQITWTFLAIAGHGAIWFWNATVNYSKNRKQDEVGE